VGRNIWLNCLKSIWQTRKDFTMQNCFVVNLKRMTILSKHFNSSLVMRDTIFYSFIIKKCITAFLNTMQYNTNGAATDIVHACQQWEFKYISATLGYHRFKSLVFKG
jgi:hypothetical protein